MRHLSASQSLFTRADFAQCADFCFGFVPSTPECFWQNRLRAQILSADCACDTLWVFIAYGVQRYPRMGWAAIGICLQVDWTERWARHSDGGDRVELSGAVGSGPAGKEIPVFSGAHRPN